MDFLKTLKAPSPVFPNDSNTLVTLSSNASVAEGFQTLISHNILSVPLFDEKTNTYINSLSIVDVILHALAAHNDADEESGVSSAHNTFCEKEHFRCYKARDIAGKSSQAPPPVITNPNVTVDQVVEIMVKTKAHHILALNGEKGKLCNVITQSRIVECISKLFSVDPGLTALGKKTVRELGLGLQDVKSISESAKAADAFRLLADKKVSGIAVLNNSGVLVDNISVRDLRAIKCNAAFLKLLSHTVAEYLQAAHTEFGIPKSVVKCTEHDTYRDVMERLVENKVHRCYVVGGADKLIGVVSMWDLLSELVSFSGTVNAP